MNANHSIFKGWLLFVCGIFMGMADLVPGISGGTIAFILGFYQPLLESLQTLNWTAFQYLLTGRWKAFSKRVAWKFLLTLFIGILFAFISFANIFHFILAHEVYRVYLYSTFLGLIVASFVICIRQVRRWKKQIVFNLLVGALAAFLLTETTLAPVSEGEFAVPIEINDKRIPLRNYDFSRHVLTGVSSQTLAILISQGIVHETTPIYNQEHVLIGVAREFATFSHLPFFLNSWLILSGIFAVCALLLPGVSGSYILTLLGVYPTVIEALVEFFNDIGRASFNLDAFVVLGNLGVGIIIGALAFAHLVTRFLRHYPDQSFALLSGFMIGAIRSVWPFWSYEYFLLPLKLSKGPQLITLDPFIPSWESPLVWQGLMCAVTGFIVVFALELYVKRNRIKLSSVESVIN